MMYTTCSPGKEPWRTAIRWHQRDRKIQFAFDKENFIKQFVFLHLILSSLQKVRIARIGRCSFLMDGFKGKSWGQRRGGKPISARQVAAAPLPTNRQGACSARSRLFLGMWSRSSLLALRPVACGGSGYHGDGAWLATVTREPVEKAAAAGGREVGRGLHAAGRPRPLRTGWVRSVSQERGPRQGRAWCLSGEGGRSPHLGPAWGNSRETTAPGLRAPKGRHLLSPPLPSPPPLLHLASYLLFYFE